MNTRWLTGIALLLASCAPELDDRPYLVERERLIAVVADPPELRPRAEVRVTPVVAARRRITSELSFHFCAQPPPPADPRPISEACLDDARLSLMLDDEGARGTVPAEACARFGPDPVGSDFRPRDPDETGGFFQPLVVTGGGAASVAQVRIICPLPDLPIDLARAYSERYPPNRNPTGLRLEREIDGEWRAWDFARRGERARVRVAWDELARERYVWLSPDGTALQDRVEAFEVSWFVTGGAFDQARTAVSEAEPRNDSENTFQAPDRAARLELWAVVRDSRGGTAVAERTVEIED